jgi:CheY-like chemotaxis protein
MQSQKPKILLVDDEQLVRELLARLLAYSGFAVEEAENGAAALQMARQLDGSLSLVVTDINMPVMNGLDFARALRSTDPRIPFLFITAVDPALIHEPGLRAEILVKPFTPDVFLETVSRMIAPVSGPGQLA